MGSTVRQTLYPASGRDSSTLGEFGSGAYNGSETTQTVAQAHDASDATYDRHGFKGDGLDFGSGTYGVQWTLDSCTYAGTIDKVRVRMRVKYVRNDGGDPPGFVPWFNADTMGSWTEAPGSFGWLEFDFPTKPAGGAWTAATINSAKWGFLCGLDTLDELATHYADGYLAEYEVQVFSSDAETSTGSSLDMEAGIEAGTSTGIGTVTNSGASLDMEAEIPAGTPVPSTTRIAGSALEMELGIEDAASADVVAGSFDPSAVVPLASRADGNPTATILRAYGPDDDLGDGSLYTYKSDAKLGPYTGTLGVYATSVGETSLYGSGDISGVIVHAYARVLADEGAANVTSPLCVLPGQNVTISTIPSGDSMSTDYGHIYTALITTKDGTHPWSWATMFTDLLGVGVRCSVAYAGFIGVALQVAELWVEVYGPIGSRVDPIVVTKVTKSTLRKVMRVRGSSSIG